MIEMSWIQFWDLRVHNRNLVDNAVKQSADEGIVKHRPARWFITLVICKFYQA